MPEALTHYAVIRYLADPLREEPRNIGVLVICPDLHFGAARFLMHRTGLKPDSPRYRAIRDILSLYQSELSELHQEAIFWRAHDDWDPSTLQRLHEESTNLLQFSKPGVAKADPAQLVQELYETRVVPTTARLPRGHFSRATVTATLRRLLEPKGKAAWVQEDASVVIGGQTYFFDLGIKNGRLYYAIEALSFRNQDLQRVEQVGGWYAHVWPRVAEDTQATALLIVEPPRNDKLAAQRYERVYDWANTAGIVVRSSSQLAGAANEVVASLPDS